MSSSSAKVFTPPQAQPRIALYSPGMIGLGHMRRNLLIAQALATSPLKPVILMIAEAREASGFSLPPGVDLLTLPALAKDANETCRPRYLDLPVEEVSNLRKNTILSALSSFKPDVLLVDHLPRGATQELNPSLEYLLARRRTYCILGLRDVLDDPAVVQRKWAKARNEEAIRRYYDAIWVYGDAKVYDLIGKANLAPDIKQKMRYVGYLDQCERIKYVHEKAGEILSGLDLPPGRLALCLVGGGVDGARLAGAFALADLPSGMNGVILTGPFMPDEARQHLHRLVAQAPRQRVLDFVPEPAPLLDYADRVVGMGGYNTTCEVLSFEKPALIVPRVRPGREQWIRAESMQKLGFIQVLHPDRVSPASLSRWLASEATPPAQPREHIDMGGLSHLYWLLLDALSAHPTPEKHPTRPIVYARVNW